MTELIPELEKKIDDIAGDEKRFVLRSQLCEIGLFCNLSALMLVDFVTFL